MNIINTKELLLNAYKKGFAVPAINVDVIDAVIGTLEIFEEKKSPLIIQISPIQVYTRNTTYKDIVEIIKVLGRNFNVDCAIHLDHGQNINDVILACDSGFTSVMYDGSKKSLEENIKDTIKIKTTRSSIPLEGEVGVIAGEEGEITNYGKSTLTDVNDAKKFVIETNIDFLAVSIGNSHGVYVKKPKLDFHRLNELNNELNIPLVLHGASGLTKKDIISSVQHGISKINFFTDVDEAFTNGIRNRLMNMPLAYSFDYLVEGKSKMQKQLNRIIGMCGSGGRS